MLLLASLKWAWFYFSICPLKWAIIGFYEGDMSYRAIIQCRVSLSYSLSRSVSVTEVPSASLSYVLHMSLRDSATAVCFTVSVGGISGIPVCGRGLLPGSPSIRRLSQSCTLLPSLPPSPNLSFSAVTRSKISVFHLVVPCFTLFFETKRHFSVCHPDDDWQGTESSVVLIPLKSFRKWILAV